MSTPSVLNLQQSCAQAGTDRVQFCQLTAGQAVRFQAKGSTELHVTQGRVWVTLDGPHCGAANNWGDVVLQAGERLSLQQGQGLVVESWGGANHAAQARLVGVLAPAALPVLRNTGATVGSAFGAWLAQAGRPLVSRDWRGSGGGRFGGFFGRFLGGQGRLQCQASPGCHSVG